MKKAYLLLTSGRAHSIGNPNLEGKINPHSSRILNFSPPLYVLPNDICYFSGVTESQKNSRQLIDRFALPYGSVLPPECVSLENDTILVGDIESMLKNLLCVPDIRDALNMPKENSTILWSLTETLIQGILIFLKDFSDFFRITHVFAVIPDQDSQEANIVHPEWSVSLTNKKNNIRGMVHRLCSELGFQMPHFEKSRKTRSTVLHTLYNMAVSERKNVIYLSHSPVCRAWLQVAHGNKNGVGSTVLQYDPREKIFICPQDIMRIHGVPQSKLAKLLVFQRTAHIGPSKARHFIENEIPIHHCGAEERCINHYFPAFDEPLAGQCREMFKSCSEAMLRKMLAFQCQEKIYFARKSMSISPKIQGLVKEVCQLMQHRF